MCAAHISQVHSPLVTVDRHAKEGLETETPNSLSFFLSLCAEWVIDRREEGEGDGGAKNKRRRKEEKKRE